MKKISVIILCLSVFFMGLGSLLQEAGAKFKSDERALGIIRQARVAIGGDENINRVQSMTITGKTTHRFMFDAVERSETADLEINLQLPNLFTKMIKMQTGGGEGQPKGAIEMKEVDVFVTKSELKNVPSEGQENVVVIKKGKDGNQPAEKISGTDVVIVNKGKDGNVITEDIRGGEAQGGKQIVLEKQIERKGNPLIHNELWRTMLGLLLSPPQNVDVSFTFAGEGNVDGTACDIVNVQSNDSSIKIYFDKTSHFPIMMSWQGNNMPKVIRLKKADGQGVDEKEIKLMAKGLENPETVEFQLKFSDYRSVGGLQLPFKWTQTAGGKADQTIDVTSYEINPPNIAEKFKKLPKEVKIKVETQKN